jgi:hypothetical protein
VAVRGDAADEGGGVWTVGDRVGAGVGWEGEEGGRAVR